jgi:hypothetical protein
MSNETAVDKLWNLIPKDTQNYIIKQFNGLEQAKEMEKEQMIDAASDHCYPTCETARTDAEQYYNETYGGNK